MLLKAVDPLVCMLLLWLREYTLKDVRYLYWATQCIIFKKTVVGIRNQELIGDVCAN